MKKPLSSLDLNLLLCLQLLTQELSVTRTAKRMNVSPSAVSKSLAKLRAWFDDPLFVKTPLGLAPTPLVSAHAAGQQHGAGSGGLDADGQPNPR